MIFDVNGADCELREMSPLAVPAERDAQVVPVFQLKMLYNYLILLKLKLSHWRLITHTVILATLTRKSILPDFDPSKKGQRVDTWLKKVNECATVYRWDEKTTIHFALQKLQGLAKTWYGSLDSILFTCSEWELKLLNAFQKKMVE